MNRATRDDADDEHAMARQWRRTLTTYRHNHQHREEET